MSDPNNVLYKGVGDVVRDKQLSQDAKRPSERLPSKQIKDNINPTYPLNRVTTYPDGTEIHFDSTPNFSRYEFRHSSGNLLQIADDGMETKIVVGNSFTNYKEGMTLTISQNGDITINGHARVNINGGAHVEVKGDLELMTTGDMIQHVGGNYKLSVGGDFITGTSGQVCTTSGGDHQILPRGSFKMQASEASTMISGRGMVKKAPKIDFNP